MSAGYYARHREEVLARLREKRRAAGVEPRRVGRDPAKKRQAAREYRARNVEAARLKGREVQRRFRARGGEYRGTCAECGGPCTRGVRCHACHAADGARRKAARAIAAAERTAVRLSQPVRSPEEKRAAVTAWRRAHPGYMREYYQQNRERLRPLIKAREKARRKSTVDALMKAQRGRCAYCRDPLGADFHVDHIVPLSKGGPNRRSNLQLTCADCNLAKSAKDPIVFAQSLGRLI